MAEIDGRGRSLDEITRILSVRRDFGRFAITIVAFFLLIRIRIVIVVLFSIVSVLIAGRNDGIDGLPILSKPERPVSPDEISAPRDELQASPSSCRMTLNKVWLRGRALVVLLALDSTVLARCERLVRVVLVAVHGQHQAERVEVEPPIIVRLRERLQLSRADADVVVGGR